ncbi:Endo-1,4-beta-xylanase A precursor [compost metagenome]
MEGFEDGTLRPEARITRSELAVMTSRAMKAAGRSAAGGNLQFADAEAIPQWAREAVSASVGAGIIQGAEGNRFAPVQQATRAEAAVMLKRLLQAVEFING